MSHHKPKCECGATYVIGDPENEAWHNQFHEEYSLGPDVSEVQSLRSIASKESLRLVVVDNTVEESIRKAVAQVAVVAQRCMPDYKFGYYGVASDSEQRLYAFVDKTRIVGIVTTSLEKYLWRFAWTPESGFQPSETNRAPFSGPKVTRIWIAASYRRRGLAKWLIQEVGKHLKCDVQSLGWEMPLTESGKSLVKSVCAEEFLGCGNFRSS